MLDTFNTNNTKTNPQTAMQGIELSEQAAENLTPNQNKTADELLQNTQHLQEPQPTPQTKPTLVQGVEQFLNDNLYPTSKQENSAGIEISEQSAENLNKSKDIEASANALINETYAMLEAQEAMKTQRALQAIKAQAKKASQTQGIIDGIKGKGFTAQNPQNVTEPLKVEFDMQEWAKLTSGIKLDAQLRADLEKLATKHPEMFKKPSDVFKLLMKIKNNPTHFLPNNRDDVAMIAKILNDKKIGKMGIKKENGEVVHLTNRDIRPKDAKVNSPLAVEPPTHYHTSIMEQGDGANAHLLKDNAIIPQNAEQFYNLHNRVLDLKSALKEASIDQANNNQWFEKWGEDVNKAYSRHKELAQKLNNTPQSFDDFSAELQDLLQKHTQAKTRNAAKIQDLQKQIEQTQKAIDDFKIQGYEKVDGYFLPTDYKNSSDFIAKIGDLGESNKYALFNALKSKNFETGLSQFLESFSKTHTQKNKHKK